MKMNNNFITSLSLLILTFFTFSCSTEDIVNELEELLPETTVLETISVTEATLIAGTEENVFDTYKWSQVKYNGVEASTYELRLHLDEKYVVLKSTSELMASVTNGELNAALMELSDSMESLSLKISVVSSFEGAIETESEAQALTVTMIAKEEPVSEEPEEEEPESREPHENDGVWGVIGSSTESGWDSDQDMLYDAEAEQYILTLDLVAGEMKFRKDDDWAVNLGGSAEALVHNGDNIVVAEAGNYTITLTVEGADDTTTGVATITKN